MTFITLDDITLYHKVEGSVSGVPLVFINSLGTDLRIWDQVVPHFADRFPIVRYDKRGHGLSDAPPAPYSIRDHANDLARLLDHLPHGEAILAGISVGGMIALDYTIRHPEQVRALVLCDTAARLGTVDSWNERIDAIHERGMDWMAGTIVPRWFAPAFARRAPAAYRGYHNMLARMPVEGYTGTCAALRDADLRAQVPAVQTEALVLCGAEDRSTAPEVVRGLAETLPNGRFALIEAAGHLPCVEQPDAVAAEINHFLRENGYV